MRLHVEFYGVFCKQETFFGVALAINNERLHSDGVAMLRILPEYLLCGLQTCRLVSAIILVPKSVDSTFLILLVLVEFDHLPKERALFRAKLLSIWSVRGHRGS